MQYSFQTDSLLPQIHDSLLRPKLSILLTGQKHKSPSIVTAQYDSEYMCISKIRILFLSNQPNLSIKNLITNSFIQRRT
ncbi:hypothetical protein MTR_1g105950 [Medicago truncatula]|uniref:Uncharacterized protein n=1 Tax=Medicago truncatula TaxID=3880 RepID=A0A072VQQ1_MEDTR|nr:hypothetical protein MTR_1g105950 [Medicago truncatula]